jgi:hypothetical protein
MANILRKFLFITLEHQGFLLIVSTLSENVIHFLCDHDIPRFSFTTLYNFLRSSVPVLFLGLPDWDPLVMGSDNSIN